MAKAVVSDVGHGAHEAWDKVKDGAKTAYSAVTNEARSIGQGYDGRDTHAAYVTDTKST